MEWLLSLVLGLLIAWTILTFIGPTRTLSYYVQAPVQAVSLSDLDKIMGAVGLKPSGPENSHVAVAIMEGTPPAPPALPSVAEVASPAPIDASDAVAPPSGQGTSATPQPFVPAPGPSPPLE